MVYILQTLCLCLMIQEKKGIKNSNIIFLLEHYSYHKMSGKVIGIWFTWSG